MNFKKLAEQKIDELSGKIPGKIDDVDSIDLVIEGLDEEIDQEESVVAEDISIELVDDELDIEKSEEKNEIQPVELFDGYLGQQKDVPNPLEYGPNATYRNLREGIVYKKGPDNLWEVFVKDGQNGKQGQSLGSGVGVEEVKRIISENVVASSTYPNNGYSYYPEIESYFGDNIVALWDFSEETGESKISKVGFPYALKDGGTTISPRISGGPLSNYANSFDANKFLRLENGLVGDLNLAKFGNNVSIIVISRHTSLAGSQFLAGMWQELDSDARRQYGLFTSLSTYGGAEQVCGHISVSGGNSPKVLTSGFLPYSRDYASNVTKLELNTWIYQSMVYNGNDIKVYVDGKFEPRPVYTEPAPTTGESLTYSKNPYIYTSGLNRVTAPAGFSVGANKLSTWTNNVFGDIACVAVFKDALTQKQIVDFQRMVQGKNRPNINYSMYHNSYASGERGVNNIGWFTYYGPTATSGNNTYSWYLAFPTSGTLRYLEKKPTANQAICFDDQNFGITLSTINKLTVDTNNANTTDTIKFALKSNNTWYLSNTSFTQTVSGISGTNWTNVETKSLSSVSTETWLPVTLVPGSTFTIGSGVVLPETSIIDAIGIYSPGTTNFVRVRNLAIW